MKRTWVAGVAAMALFFGWSGCATLPRAGGMAVSLVSIRPVETALLETTAELTLRFTNETTRRFQLDGGSHRLYVNGSYVGRAVTNQTLTVPELGTATQILTAHLGNLALLRTAQELEKSAVVDYRIDSELHLGRESGGGSLAATATGRLDLSGFLASSPVAASSR